MSPSVQKNIENQLERLLNEFQSSSKERQQELAVEIRTQAEAYKEITGKFYFHRYTPQTARSKLGNTVETQSSADTSYHNGDIDTA